MSSKQTKTFQKRNVPIRNVTNNFKRTAKPKAKTVSTSFDLSKISSDITNSFTSGLNKPLVLLALLSVSAIVVTHQTDFSSGAVGKWVAEGVKTNNTLATWINTNQTKFLGLAIFVPSLLDSPKNVQLMLSLATLLWVLLIPQASIYEYVIQSLGMHTYFRVKQQNTRIFILLSVAIAYFGGFLTKTQ